MMQQQLIQEELEEEVQIEEEVIEDELFEDALEEVPIVQQHQPRGPRRGRQRGQPAGNAVRHRGPRIYIYNRRWEFQPRFSRWLRSVPNNVHRAKCIVCQSTFQANLDTIKGHGRGDRHQQRLAQLPEEDVNAADNLEREEREFKMEVSRIVIMVALYFARNRLPFCIIKSFFNLVINISSNMEALKAAKMGKTKFTCVTTWLGEQYKADLKHQLRTTKFAVLFDEATDVSKKKHGAVVVRFFSIAKNCVVEALWSVIDIFDDANRGSVASAQVIYDRITQSFDSFREIPRRNVLSFCSDGCATMVGAVNSVAQRFRQSFLNIICIICPAHAIYLVGAGAYRLLPDNIQQLPRSIYNLFNSPKRLDKLKKQQENLGLKVRTVLRAPPTRWLTLGPAITRLIEQWPALSIVVEQLANANIRIGNADEDANNARINLQALRETMADPITSCYLAFISDVVPLLENFNGKMQRTLTMIPYVYDDIIGLLREIISRFTNENFLVNNDFVNINYREIGRFIDVDVMHMNVGEAAERALQAVENPDLQLQFRNVCFNFYVALVEEIKERLEVVWRPMRHVNCLVPQNALLDEYHEEHPGVMTEMMLLFSRAADELGFDINVQTLTAEWNNLLMYDWNLGNLDAYTIESFWFTMMNKVHPVSGVYLCRNLSKFALNICCIPHGNAQPERIWSREKNTKTPLRNLMSLKVENAVLLLNDMLRLYDCYHDICNYIPTQQLIQGILEKKYNPPKRRRNNENNNNNNEDAGLLEVIVPQLIAGANGVDIDVREHQESDEEEEVDEWEDDWASDDLDINELQVGLQFEGLDDVENDVEEGNLPIGE